MGASKYISYSLWGDNPKYTVGALENASMVDATYGDKWKAIFFIDETVDKKIIDKLHAKNADIVKLSGYSEYEKVFMRYEAVSLSTANIVLFRDADSRLSMREVAAVAEWEISKYSVHVMRDHPRHTAPIMGGMWGVKKGFMPDFIERVKKWRYEIRNNLLPEKRIYGKTPFTDQHFIYCRVFDNIKEKILAHDDAGRFPSVGEVRKFPVGKQRHSSGRELFVGQVWTEYNIPIWKY